MNETAKEGGFSTNDLPFFSFDSNSMTTTSRTVINRKVIFIFECVIIRRIDEIKKIILEYFLLV